MRLNGKANVYENIVAEFKELIAVGALLPGDKLPSVRSYAVERKVNPNTVAKAYATLEEEGLIAVQPKKGAYVANGQAEKKDCAEEVIRTMGLWRELGISKESIYEALVCVYGESKKDGEKI